MNLQHAQQIAVDTIKYYCPLYSFQFDGSKKRFGFCSQRRKLISLSKKLTELNTEEIFINTLLHEIVHALAPITEHHGNVWRAIAKNIGCGGERCYSSEVLKPTHTYIGTCPGCSKTIKRFRRKQIACSNCCQGVYQSRFKFVWSKNKGE